MAVKRERVKGRANEKSYFGIPHEVLQSKEWSELTPRAVKLVMDLGSQFFGANNGDLTAAWTIMKNKGWTSKDQLNKARKEILDKGFVITTRQGGRNKATLYGLTFKRIDECISKKTKRTKLDVKPTRTPPNTWKKNP